jgi:predicted metal-dependent phosphotriesterase family hydrolase
MTDHNNAAQSHLVDTVLGPLSHLAFGITDAHNHLWIAPVNGTGAGNPVLDQKAAIVRELEEYSNAGGATILDCQPGGCGRDANILAELSASSNVNIIACTGFHRRKYYPENHTIWNYTAQKWTEYLVGELDNGIEESLTQPEKIKAGFIKIALEATWEFTPQQALEGAMDAGRETGALIEVHTEKGAFAEKVMQYFMKKGVHPSRIVLCHMDKRMDIGLHTELAQAGALLEYDTFFRPKYNPEENLWTLIDQMVNVGLSDRIALATDMAESESYHSIGGGPGLASLPGIIRQRLASKHIPEHDIRQMLGENIARRLAGLS